MSELLPQLVQQLFNGLSLGAIYALIAIGYTMVYGIIGMINFAHGDIYMIGAYVGLTPSESSSGASRALGGITKTGNGHARRLLIEAAWHHRPAYRPTSPIMRARWDRASAAARARGHAGNQRLHDRWVGFQVRKKRSVVANAAIARELAGWCWSLAVMT